MVITGPTCVGKTKLSVLLAKYFNGEIINCDSTQVYKYLNIATAKATIEEQSNIKHHLMDFLELEQDYTIFDYQKDAREVIKKIENENKLPIMVGGTGLYIKSCLYDYSFLEEEKHDLSNLKTDELYEILKNINSDLTIDKNNRQRLERAYNYYLNHGKLNEEKNSSLLYDTLFIGLTTNRENLYNKINKRVDTMINNGLLEEAKMIYDLNIKSKAVMTPIGYKELFLYFEKIESLDVCLEKIKQRSRKYAKRQYTFFNHQLPINWLEVDYDNFDNTVNAAIKLIEQYKKDTKN